MSETRPGTCLNCGTILVPSKKEITFDGTLAMDGTWNFNNEICPKCHPELAKIE